MKVEQTLRFLGRGNAFNIKEGNTSAYFKRNNTLLLFDCGYTVFPKLMETNVLEEVEDVYIAITHLHADHIGSLPALIDYCNYFIKTKPVIISLDNRIIDLLRLQGINLNEDYLSPEVLINEKMYFRHGDIVISLEAIQVTHSLKLINCSYIITINNKSIYYSGDSLDIPQKVIEQLSNMDELYQDTANYNAVSKQHMSLLSLEQRIPAEFRNKVFCMHIDETFEYTLVKEMGFNVVELN